MERDMITAYILIGLGGLAVGSITTIAIQKDRKKDEVVVVSDTVALEQQEVVKQLTNLDLLVVPCSTEYISQAGDLLCREMYCRVMTRGIDSQTAGQECEQISNVANSKIMIEHCETFIDQTDDCYDKYRERK